MSADALRDRWRALWPGAAIGAADAVYRDLVARYAEPHRAYHTLDHVAGCLRLLDEVRPLPARPDEVELALWFHDAIYDPRRADNEEQSAQLAAGALSALGVAEVAAGRVADLIRLTDHRAVDLTSDGALVTDVDLAILGAEPAAFDAYDAAIRREYTWVPEQVFYRERAHILEGFLARKRIYQIPALYDRFEQRARDNVTKALGRYRSQ